MDLGIEAVRSYQAYDWCDCFSSADDNVASKSGSGRPSSSSQVLPLFALERSSPRSITSDPLKVMRASFNIR